MAKRQRQYATSIADLEFSKEFSIREQIAREAARIIVESGVYDVERAKIKSAHRFGIKNKRYFPDNILIQKEVIHFQQLFKGDKQRELIRKLREIALHAMMLFEDFHPHLVGPVLQGCATQYSGVDLHIFADTPEMVDLFLTQKLIPFTISQTRFQLCNNTYEIFLTYHLNYKDIPVDVTIFPMPVHRIQPRDKISQRPMERASTAKLKQLL